MTNTVSNQRKRLLQFFFLLLIVAIIVVWNVFSTYTNSSSVKKEKYLLRFNLNELQQGEVRIVQQNGLPIVIMYRTKQDLKDLLAIRSFLADPESDKSNQPDFAKNYHRSLKPEFFIAYAVTSKRGITVNYRLKNYKNAQIPGQQWYGGFTEERQTGYVYDKAGRIYKQPGLNLDVPNYKITPDNQLYVYTLKELDFD